MRTQVRSLAFLSGLRIWCCCKLWYRSQMQLQFDPLAWELPYAAGVALKKKNKKNEIQPHLLCMILRLKLSQDSGLSRVLERAVFLLLAGCVSQHSQGLHLPGPAGSPPAGHLPEKPSTSLLGLGHFPPHWALAPWGRGDPSHVLPLGERLLPCPPALGPQCPSGPGPSLLALSPQKLC